MLSLLHSLKKLFKSVKYILKEEDIRSLLILIATILAIGTAFYSIVEKLSILDALYLSFITLTTIGYGDFYPVTSFGKIFTMIYSIIGLGIMAMFISIVSKSYIKYNDTRKHKRHKEHKEKSVD
jgi:voltage-gated potassium channel